MAKSTNRIIAVIFGIGVLMGCGYLVGRWVRTPQVVTQTVEESAAELSPPSHQMVLSQIRALTERDPTDAASEVFLNEDPWVYGVRSGGALLVPGIPKDSKILTDGILPVKVIAWTGLKGANLSELDGAAKRYAEAFNRVTVQILLTN